MIDEECMNVLLVWKNRPPPRVNMVVSYNRSSAVSFFRKISIVKRKEKKNKKLYMVSSLTFFCMLRTTSTEL